MPAPRISETGAGDPADRVQKRPLDEASRRAEIAPAATFLRHTHGSHLAMNGVPMGDIAAQLGPKRLAAGTAYGTGRFLVWLVGRGIAPHIPVRDASERDDGTFSRCDFP
jgi:hypothetical protein